MSNVTNNYYIEGSIMTNIPKSYNNDEIKLQLLELKLNLFNAVY